MPLEELAFGLWSGQLPQVASLERRVTMSVGLSLGFADGGSGDQRDDTLSAKPLGWQLRLSSGLLYCAGCYWFFSFH